MKRKQIEKMPFLMLPELVPDKEVRFVGRTAWKNIGHERHIILEIYKNKKDCMQVPVVRYVATKKDWGVYEPGAGWGRRKIESYEYGYRMCWYDGRETVTAYGDLEKENRLYSGADLSRIRGFFRNVDIKPDENWMEYFRRHERSVRYAETRKKNERRVERLEERGRNTPELKQEELLGWADRMIFHNKHYLFYRKKGQKATVCCTACGRAYSGKWKVGESYEDMFKKHIEEPRERQMGKCILCGEPGEYKPQGKIRGACRERGHVFLADKYLEKGVVLRYIELRKEWGLKVSAGKDGKAEMRGAYEELDMTELARTYFLPGKKPQTDFCKYNPWSGKNIWDDCNLSGMGNISILEAPVYPDSWDNLKGTFLQYSGMREYCMKNWQHEINAEDYLERYQQFPQMEMLVKGGLYLVVKEMVRGRCGIIQDENADRLESFLGIRKDKVKLLAEEGGNIRILKILQKEKKLDANWTWQQVRALSEIGAENRDMKMALKLMSVQKLLNNISKYAGCGYGTGCGTAESMLRATASTYFDYLQMRQSLGYDMQNTVYLKPRDLEAAHDRMVAEQNKEKADERLKEVAEKYPDIRKSYRRLRKRYFYEDDMFLIRPARSAEEIVMEGRTLHHCVGGNGYLGKHNRGESYILMLRFKKMPETPYITVEISGEGQILQWYGCHDKKPDKENMQKWLDIYETRVKAGELNTEGKTEEEARARVPIMAAG